jgi:hypothetical protein
MLWLLGTICVLLGLLVIGLYLIQDRVIQLVGEAEVINVHLDSIAKETRSARSSIGALNEGSHELLKRSRSLEHLKDIPEILRHLTALRELTYGRKTTEHDSLPYFKEWPSASRMEEFRESEASRKKRAATSKSEPDQPSADESEP